MPKITFEKYGVEIRPNEHNHYGQEAHVHLYIHGEEVASMFLDGTIRDGKLKGKDEQRFSDYVKNHADYYQEKWDEYQSAEY